TLFSTCRRAPRAHCGLLEDTSASGPSRWPASSSWAAYSPPLTATVTARFSRCTACTSACMVRGPLKQVLNTVRPPPPPCHRLRMQRLLPPRRRPRRVSASDGGPRRAYKHRSQVHETTLP